MRVLNEAAEFCEALYDGIICYNYIHELSYDVSCYHDHAFTRLFDHQPTNPPDTFPKSERYEGFFLWKEHAAIGSHRAQHLIICRIMSVLIFSYSRYVYVVPDS